MRAHLDAAFDADERAIVVDLTTVEFVDSSFLHELLRAVRRARAAGGAIALVCADRQIRRMLAVFGIERAVEIHASVGDAAESLGAET